MTKNAVILVSGGIDSYTTLGIAIRDKYAAHVLSFDYGQNNRIELEKCTAFVKQLPVMSHKIVKIDLRAFGASALTDSNIAIPKYRDAEELKSDIPITYVPARNTIFLSYALAYAEVTNSSDIFIGVHASDYSNYPDCRPEYISAYEGMANLATAMTTNGTRIRIRTPIIYMTKAEIVAKGIELGLDYSQTISCYDPTIDGLSCGTCHSCLLRIRAFEQNNIQDPTSYIIKK